MVTAAVLAAIQLGAGLPVYAHTNTGAVNTGNFIRGVDVSTLDMLEDLGAAYYQNGTRNDALTILRNNGANYVRLKLWVDPYDEAGNAYGGEIMTMQLPLLWPSGPRVLEWEC